MTTDLDSYLDVQYNARASVPDFDAAAAMPAIYTLAARRGAA